MCGGRIKNEGAKNKDIVSYALEVSVNGVTCVFVVHFITHRKVR